MGTVFLIALIIILIFAVTLKSQATYSLREGSNRVSELISQQQNSVNQFAQDITNDSKRIDNYQLFFTENQAEYLERSQEEFSNNDFYYLPLQMGSFFSNFADAKKIILTNEHSKNNILVTEKELSGTKIVSNKTNVDGFYYSAPLVDKSYLETIGSVIVFFSPAKFTHIFNNLVYQNDIQFMMLSETGDVQYSYHLDKDLKSKELRNIYSNQSDSKTLKYLSKKYLINRITFDNGKSSYLLIAKSAIYKRIAFVIVLVLLVTMMIILFLRTSFIWVFEYYQKQMQRMAGSMKDVVQGNFQTRLHIPRQEGEIRSLTTGINSMLDAIDQYGLKIYQLELAQKDAKLHMLQAQINPHFLSNTLEYIRMYALTEGQEELADVVYSFSSLLKQSINQENEVTFEQEVDLAEKYSYLFQMRYPNKIAYQYHIDDSLKNLKVPKFTIQPIVENYFKHGLDLTRDDNVVSIKIRSINNICEIVIKDNGRGISISNLQTINKLLNKNTKELLNSDSSIGLVNVKTRLNTYFEKDFKFTVSSKLGQGTKITIQFNMG